MSKPENSKFVLIVVLIAVFCMVFFSIGYHTALNKNSMDLDDSIEYVEWRMDNLPAIGTTISQDMTLRQFKDIYFGRQKEARQILRWELQNMCGIQEEGQNVSNKPN